MPNNKSIQREKIRTARNPKAGTVVSVPERKAIVWKMGKALRERVRQ